MTKSESSLSARLGMLALAIAAIAALVGPAAGSAQDPAGDQYAPTSPNGGGDYDFGPTGSGEPSPASGAGSDPGGDAGAGTGPAVTPTTPSDPAGTPEIVGPDGSGAAEDPRGNRDQRTVNQIGDAGRQARDDDTALNTSADARLTSSDANTSAGLGAGLWVLLAVALLWAVVLAVVNFRRRSAQSSPSERRGDGRQPA